MDFAPSPAIEDLLAKTGEFLQREIYPLEPLLLQHRYGELGAALERVRDSVRQAGWWTPQIPRRFGGAGLSLLEYAQLSAILGRSPLGHFAFNCQAPDAGNMELLLEHASEEQQERFLMPLLRGQVRSCFGMTEPEYPGSNPVWMGTRAIRDGGDYVLNGHKWFASAADGAAFAIVMAVTDPQAPPHERATQILVPTETPGFRLVRNIPVMGGAGAGYFSHGEIRLEDCRVPLSNRLGEEGAGFRLAQARLGPGRIHHCARWIGVCERAFDLMCARAAARELAPGEALGRRQTVQEWIATSRAEIDSCRWMVLHAAWKIDSQGAAAARQEISLIKFHVAGVLMQVIDRAVQVHGALGLTDDTLLAYLYRHERGARIYDGPDEVHKMVVARGILKRYAAG